MKNYCKQVSVTISEVCFYVFFVSLLFAKGIGLYDGQFWFKIFLLAAMAGWGGKQLFTRYTMKEAAAVVLLSALGGVIYLNTHEKGALFCLLLITGMKGIEIKRVFRVGIVTWVLSFGSLFLLTSLHIADSSFKVHDKLGLGRIVRWNLGYAHPNVLHISCFVLVCFIVYLLQERFKLQWFLILEAINLYVFMYSLSSTGFIAVNVCLFLALYWSIRKKYPKWEKVLTQLCLPFCLLLSLAAPVILKEPLFGVINKIINNRLILSQWFLQNQPAKLFGVDTRELVTSLRTMDNSYVFAYITYGIVFIIVMTVVYLLMISKKVGAKDKTALCIILSCLVAGITEPFLFNTSFKNLSLLFAGEILFAANQSAKEISVLGKADREINLKLPDGNKLLEDVKNAVRGHRKLLAVTAVVCGMAVGFVCYENAQMPARYIMPRTAFESTNDIEETYHLMSENDIPETGDVIWGYTDEKTDMVPFSGNIAIVERFRNTFSAGMLTMVLVYAAGCLYWWRKAK